MRRNASAYRCAMTMTRRLWRGLPVLAASFLCSASTPPLTEIAPPATGIGATGEQFGYAVAIDGPRRVVGAINRVRVDREVAEGVRSGAVLIYEGDAPPKLLQLPNGAEGDLFGAALALCGDWLLVGAPLLDAGGEDAGAVYGFRQAGGVFELQGRADGTADGQRLGSSVACSGGSGGAGGLGRAIGLRLEPGLPVSADVSLASSTHPAAVAVDAQSLWALAPSPTGSRLSRQALAGGALTGQLDLPGSDAASLLRLPTGVLAGLPGADAGRGQVLRIGTGATVALDGQIPAPGTTAERFGHALAVSSDSVRLLIGAPAANGFEGAAYWYTAMAADWTPRGRLEAVDGGEVELLGQGLALAGEEAWIGAPLQVVSDGLSQGAVFRWRLPGNGPSEPLPLLDLGRSAALARFGQAIAAKAGQLLVGAFLADTGRGADAGLAWWYAAGSTTPSRLEASDGRPDARYGVAVALDGERALVGAYFDAVDGQIDRGSAYLHERVGDQWVQRQKLIAANGAIREFFGLGVALEGGVAVVAAPGAIVDQIGAGRVHVFRRDGIGNWNDVQQLAPPAPVAFGNFGRALALAGGRLYVGEPFANVAGLAEAGAVHVYREISGSFVLEATLHEPVPAAGALFGFSVAASADAALIGAPLGRDAGVQGGRAWLWQPQQPGEFRQLQPGGLQAGELYGFRVALAGDQALVAGVGYARDEWPSAGRSFYWRSRGGAWAPRMAWSGPRPFGEQFGTGLAIDGRWLWFGAPAAPRLSPQEGAVYRADADELLGASGFEQAATVSRSPP